MGACAGCAIACWAIAAGTGTGGGGRTGIGAWGGGCAGARGWNGGGLGGAAPIGLVGVLRAQLSEQ